MELDAAPAPLPAPHSVPPSNIAPASAPPPSNVPAEAPANGAESRQAQVPPAPAMAKNDVPISMGDRVKNPKQKGYGTVDEIIDGDEPGVRMVCVIWDTQPDRKKRRYFDSRRLRKVLPGEAEWLVPETNEGAAEGFPKWGNKCNFTLEQQKAFVESPYKMNKTFDRPCEESERLQLELGLTYEQRNSDWGRVTVCQSRGAGVGKNSAANRRVTYMCKCGRNPKSVVNESHESRGPKGQFLWPHVGCPFSLKARYHMIESPADGSCPTMESVEDERLFYLAEIEGCYEHSKACQDARPLRRRRKDPESPRARRPAIKQILAEALEAATVAPFGWVLGGPGPTERSFELGQAHSSAALDTWSVHCFDPGHHGQTEMQWAHMRNASLRLETLKVHQMSEHAIVPIVGGDIVVVVAPTLKDDMVPNIRKVKAFRVQPGMGICLKPGIWHTVFVLAEEVTCMTLTRQSTHKDFVRYLNGVSAARETRVIPVRHIPNIETVNCKVRIGGVALNQ